MPTNILMPALSPTMTEGTLAKWVKKEGDAVKAGDVIAEIETDKATMEVEAVDEGKIGKILIAEGTAGVAVNTPIAVLLEEGEDAGAMKDAPQEAAQQKETGKTDAAAPKADKPADAQGGKGQDVKNQDVKNPGANGQDKKEASATDQQATLHDTASPQTNGAQAKKAGERVFASPLARRMAEQMGVDLSSIKGSGPHGRIVKADLADGKAQSKQTAQASSAAQASPAQPQAGKAPQGTGIAPPSGPNAKQLADMLGMKYKEIPNSGVRKVIARRLVESKQNVPHFYLTIECNIDRLMSTRTEMNAQADGKFKLSVNDFVIKACANALRAYPAANTAWTDDAILQFEHADISVAVSTPNGLMTPIVKAAETKGLRQISDEVKDLAKRARDGKLKPEEFQGGTFCVSNLGMYGIQKFGAIINPPQSCILAVGAGEQKPYVDKGEIKIGTFMKCTLSVDHRSVDGSVGAEYLQILKQYIENPISMIL